MKRVIFLDIDGVLNTASDSPVTLLRPKCIAALNRITQTTGASIIISSNRRFETMAENSFSTHACVSLLKNNGVRGYVWNTLTAYQKFNHCKWPTILIAQAREAAIWEGWMNFCKENPCFQHFIAIDDDPSILELGKYHAVLTDPITGLTEADADKAIQILLPANTKK